VTSTACGVSEITLHPAFIEEVRCPHPQQKASSHKQATCGGAAQRTEIGDPKNRVQLRAEVGDDKPNQHDADIVEKAPKESHKSVKSRNGATPSA
jgi:hypothetical protein